MAYHNLPMTGSGVTDCVGSCGEQIMTNDLSKPAYCGDDECFRDAAGEIIADAIRTNFTPNV